MRQRLMLMRDCLVPLAGGITICARETRHVQERLRNAILAQLTPSKKVHHALVAPTILHTVLRGFGRRCAPFSTKL